jgi:hypothetical protein
MERKEGSTVKPSNNKKLTQDKIFDFMCRMSKAMRDENIPIVNNIVHDFHRVDQVIEEEDKKKSQAEWELMGE